MNCWQLIFLQSKANGGAYEGDGLHSQRSDWPQETWLQKRLRYLRNTRRQVFQKKTEQVWSTYPVWESGWRKAAKDDQFLWRQK
jgi:hypothetical protein